MTAEGARDQNGPPGTPPRFLTLMSIAWRAYSDHRKTLTGIFALASAAVIAANVLANLASFAAGRPVLAVIILEQIAPFFAFGVFFSFAMAASACALSDRHDSPDIRAALRSTRPVTKDLLTAGLLAGIVMVAAITLLYYLPILFLPLFFGPPLLVDVIAVDRMPFSPALTRTRELLSGEKMRALGVLMPAALVAGTLMWVAPNTVVGATAPLGTVAQQAAAIGTRVVIDALAVGFFAAVVYAVFSDVRRRKAAPTPPPERARDELPSRPSPHSKKKRRR